MEQLFDNFQGSDLFFALHSVSGYWKIWMGRKPRCKEMTFIECHEGSFQFEVMCFGSIKSPATFQRMVELILPHRDYVRLNVDDVVIFSHSLEEHIVRLRNGLENISSYCLKVKLSMYSFVIPEI